MNLYTTQKQTQKTNLWLLRERERERGKDRLGVWDSQIKN